MLSGKLLLGTDYRHWLTNEAILRERLDEKKN